MKPRALVLTGVLSLFGALIVPVRATAQNLVSTARRADITLNGNWQYVLNRTQDQIPTSGWSSTRVPEMPRTDGTRSVWYQQTFFVPSSWQQTGRRFFVTLEKAGHYAAIYCNGAYVGEHFGQFSPFQAEVTGLVLFGQNNQIQVYVHKADTTYIRPGVDIDQSACPTYNPDCIGNAYRSAAPANRYIARNWVGLVGDVTFSWRPAQFVSDVFVVSSVRNLSLTADLQVSGAGSGTITAKATVMDGATAVLTLPGQTVASGAATLEASWSNPVFWGPPPYGQPKLYTLKTQLLQNGAVLDTAYTRFGFREVWLSGTEVLLNGQRLWPVGNFFRPLSSIRYINDRRELAFMLWVAESSGSNTMQSHWDDPGDTWLQLADEMGILIVGSYFCDGRPQIQSMVDSATDWTDWEVGTTAEWVLARRNHPSVIMWRPIDVLPQGVLGAIFPQIAAAVRAADPSGRPIADGSDIDVWGQNLTDVSNPSECDDGSDYTAKLAAETKPLLTKEIYGNDSVSCAATFFNTFYNDAYSKGGLGLVSPESIFGNVTFTPSWPSISGIGNRPTTQQTMPDWINQTWTPTSYAAQFASLYGSYFQPSLLNTSPTSGDYQASGLTSALPQSVAFLVPATGQPEQPRGVLIAQDGSGTAWFVVPGTGTYELLYTNGTQDITQKVTVTAPAPF
ncbi:MAG TPA: glycoside hydrolase family 2 TIM barrel-domain containing protein [Terriglobia bacterium]|nr:glycoside hydrolase family 2 TIM barrel-domain containing protein [Terriglobia bacterium]